MLQETVVGKTRIMTTNCVLNELRTLGEDFVGAALAAKRLEKRRCSHGGNPVNAAECIKEIIGETNQFNYCVATQDLQLRDYLRRIPGIPLIYINRSVMILEPPSPATTNKVKEIEYKKTVPTSYETNIIKNNTDTPEEVPKAKKRKGPKQPNPLSCKKKKVNPQQQQQQNTSKDYPSPSYSPSVSPSNKANNIDTSSLSLNSISFTQNETPSPSTSQPNSYNYLKNYAILKNVDDILKNKTYNNIVLDRNKSRSIADMKASMNKNLDSSSRKSSNNNLSVSQSRSRSRSNSRSDSPQRHRHRRHYFSSRHRRNEVDEDTDEIQSNISSAINGHDNDTVISISTNVSNTPPNNTKSKSQRKSDKHVSLHVLQTIRSFPNLVQKRKESLSQKSPSPFDNDKTLTMSDNNNSDKSYISLTIEDIYNSEKENITGIHHRFSINNIPTISKCNVCKRRMSLVKRYLVCDDCNYRCHAKCSSLAPFSCTCTNRKKVIY